MLKHTLLDFMETTASESLENLAHRAELTKPFVTYLVKRKFSRIVLVTCGSSNNVASNVLYFLRKYMGVPVEIVTAYEFLYYDLERANKDWLYICMSQSGRSTNVNRAAKALKAAGHDVVALTENKNSPMKNCVSAIFEYGRTGVDDYVYKSFVQQTMFIMLSCMEYCLQTKKMTAETYDGLIEQITKALNALDSTREKAIDFYRNHKRMMQEMDRVIVLGCGPTMGVAKEAALKMQETYACQATAFEVEEYFHGPSLSCNKDVTFFLIDDKNSPIHSHMQDAYRAASVLTDRVIMLTNDNMVDGAYVIHLEDMGLDDVVSALYLVVPFQYFCYILMDETQVSAIGRQGKKSDVFVKIKE